MTTTISRRDKALAAQVTLPMDHLDESATTCAAWIESKGTHCHRPVTVGLLCGRHHTVAERRLVAAVEKRRTEEAQAAAEAVRLAPARRADLARIEARIARLEARLSTPVTTDLAAHGGKVNPRIQGRREQAMARDVATGAELARLSARAVELRRLLGDHA